MFQSKKVQSTIGWSQAGWGKAWGQNSFGQQSSPWLLAKIKILKAQV
jgi:hypothetical protein